MVDEFRDGDGRYVNTGTAVTLESIKTLDGVLLTGLSFPLPVPYVPGSNGRYRVKVPATLAGVQNETTVEAHVKAILSGHPLRRPCR